MFRHSCLLLFVLLHTCVFAQLQFAPEELADPKQYGSRISAQLNTIEVYEFSDTARSTFFLKNDFRSSSFANGAEWLKLSDSVEVYRIDVVYSKYPLRKGVYHEIYPLLLSRLRNLFEIDASLNDPAIEWNKVLQTHCENDRQVDGLPHGVLIWYRPVPAETDQETAGEPTLEDMHTAGAAQTSTKEIEKAVGYIMESDLFSDTLKELLVDKSIDDQRKLIIAELEKQIAAMPDEDFSKLDKIKRKKYIEELNKVVHIFGNSDNVVSKVLDRHPEWKHLYVVNDWTGSMYGYGSQVLQWHLLNLETSGVEQLTLFNDGDDKSTNDKKIGETGGIYMEKADNVEKLIQVFQLVMMKGGGGDGPENDIEAILKMLEDAPDSAEVVLIADNYPCIRDIALADRIPVPVRVIVCGYKPSYGINPDLVYLAKITNGGLYTIEEDIENLNVVLDTTGTKQIRTFNDKRFKLAKIRCESADLISANVYADFRKTRLKFRRKIQHLDLAHDLLGEVPNRVYRFYNLQTLDLTDNNLSAIESGIGELTVLRKLILADNQLTELPGETANIHYLEVLDVSGNNFETWPTGLTNMPFLQKLDLSRNQLTTIGKVVNLKRLRQLDLSDNQLSTLPRPFQLKSLKALDLSNNRFTSVPVSVCNLRKLEELDLRDNALTTLPPALTKVQSLKILRLENNAFTEEEKAKIREQFPKALVYF